MSKKVIKIKESKIKQIVSDLVNEHLGEYQPTMGDTHEEEGEEMPIDDTPQDKPETGEKFGIAIGPDGRHYVMSYETGQIIGVK